LSLVTSATTFQTGSLTERFWKIHDETDVVRLAFDFFRRQIFVLRTSVQIDRELEKELKRAQSITHEKKSTVIRHALRAGLPILLNRFQEPRPEGYFASDYPLPKDRRDLEAAMAAVKQRPDR